METDPSARESKSVSLAETQSQIMAKQIEQEGATLKQLLVLEEDFREYYATLLKETNIQKDLIERMWVLSQRYIILISNHPCSKHPEIHPTPAEERIVEEFAEKLDMLHGSNELLVKKLAELRKSCCIFESLCGDLDMKLDTPLVQGDAFHKPLSFFIELLSDLFKYFSALILKYKYCAHQLEPADSAPLEEYKKLLVPSEDFEEYLLLGLTYCKCLRPKQPCEPTLNRQQKD